MARLTIEGSASSGAFFVLSDPSLNRLYLDSLREFLIGNVYFARIRCCLKLDPGSNLTSLKKRCYFFAEKDMNHYFDDTTCREPMN